MSKGRQFEPEESVATGQTPMQTRIPKRGVRERLESAGISVVIPAFNEASGIGDVITSIRETLADRVGPCEILVVDDGSTDDTAEIAAAAGANVISHPYNLGYGRSLKDGILVASNDLIVVTDADGTYPVERIPDLILCSGDYHMVVGARCGREYWGSWGKRLARLAFRALSEFATGRRIPDINSGFRVFRRSDILPFFPAISSGFSFTTTVTLAYMLNDLFVAYVPIEYHKRQGRSKVRHLRDILRSLQIITEAIIRYNPIKAFLPPSAVFFVLGVVGALVAALLPSWIPALLSALSFATSAILLGMGFLATAIVQGVHKQTTRRLPFDEPESVLETGHGEDAEELPTFSAADDHAASLSWKPQPR
jgi:hypothetical protein